MPVGTIALLCVGQVAAEGLHLASVVHQSHCVSTVHSPHDEKDSQYWAIVCPLSRSENGNCPMEAAWNSTWFVFEFHEPTRMPFSP